MPDNTDFLSTYTPLANDIATQTGLDPSVVLGIIHTETGGGAHVLGNNIFGITPPGGVARYPDVQTAAQAFVTLMQSPRYAGVANAPDPASQAAALVKGGYNTANPAYASIIAQKAANFGKQLGYQDELPTPPVPPADATPSPSSVSINATSSESVAAPAAPATPPAQPTAPAPAPSAAPTGSAKDRVLADPALSGGDTSAAPAQPPAGSEATPASAKDRVLADPALQGGTTTTTTTAAPAAPTSWRGVARNVGAGTAVDAPSAIGNFFSDPSYYLARYPLAVALGTGWDVGARLFGYAPMTPEQRADLYNQPQPGQTQLPPEQQPLGSRVMNALDTSIPGQTAATLPASPTEAATRRGAAGALTAGVLGPSGIVPALAAGFGAAAAPVIAQNVPEEYRPFVELATNALATGGATAARNRFSGSAVDPADAATVQMARDKWKVPLDATDITPGSQFRTPESVQAKTAALQGNIVKEMGENPNTPDVLSRNRITTGPGGVMDRTATRVGQVFDDVSNRTDINTMQTNNAITKLANIDHGLDLENLTDAQKAMIRRNIDLVQDAAVRGNGSISGVDYQGLTKTGTPLDKLAGNSDPNVAAIGMQVKNAVDDAFQRSASPADQAALTQARYQWRLMKTVQPLVERAQGGNIDPGQFMTRAIAASRKLDGSTGGMAYTGGNISELARIADVINRGPAPVSHSLVGDIFNPPAGGTPYYFNPRLAAALHAAQIVRNQVSGPYLRSGFNAQQVIANALNPPSAGAGFAYGAIPGLVNAANPLQRP